MEIKLICEKYGLTQTALAKRFDIPIRTVQDWYSGRRNPPLYVVGMMMELLERDCAKKLAGESPEVQKVIKARRAAIASSRYIPEREQKE